MANEYGFFAAKEHDRRYSADDISALFADFFTNGVLCRSTAELAVSAHHDMTVSVSGGTGYINGRWFRKEGETLLTLSEGDEHGGRYDAVVLRCDYAERSVYLDIVEGTPSRYPERPLPQRDSSRHELVLAYIYIGAGETSARQQDIYDTRGDSALCGFVTGTVKQIDATDLFAQFRAAWDDFISQLPDGEHVTIYASDTEAREAARRLGMNRTIQSMTEFI